MKNITVMTPTRGRASQCLNHIQSVIVRAKEKDFLKIWLWIDEDDPELQDYLTYLNKGPYAEWVQIMSGPQMPLGRCWNAMAFNEFQQGDIFFMGNDDWFMQTDEWDEILRDEVSRYKDDVYVMYPYDGNDNKCTFPIVSKRWIKTTGYFVPEIFEFLANDTYLERVGKKLGRLFQVPIYLDHRHFAFGKSQYDQTYRQHRDSGATKRDVQLLNQSNDLIDQDVEKLKALME